jgi:hypothetical protein
MIQLKYGPTKYYLRHTGAVTLYTVSEAPAGKKCRKKLFSAPHTTKSPELTKTKICTADEII